MTEYRVRRVGAPSADGGQHNQEATWSQLGEQPEWAWGWPGVFHALAAPLTDHPIPARPHAGHSSHDAALGYWSALNHILVYRLGWSRPHRGMQRWYEAGTPTDDPTLALVERIWARDGDLDVYVAWLMLKQPDFLGSDGISATRQARDELEGRWPDFVRRAVESSREVPWFDLDGGHDPLHLTGHIQTDEPGQGHLMVDPGGHRATVVIESAVNWYWTLAGLGCTLPPIGERSWHVEVFVKPIGFMGTFRQSRQTGLWFTGRHSTHMLGN